MTDKNQPYSDASDDALGDVLSLVNDILANGVYYSHVTWNVEELEELKRWLEKRLADR